MSNSIYNVATHSNSSSQAYGLNDIVKHGDYYYYCTQAHPDANAAGRPSDTSLYWNGTTVFGDAGTLPYFFWRPSYNYSVKLEPRNRVVSFGDGYEQRTPDGIQNNLLQIDLTFPTRNEDEASAILHFFHTRNASEGFVFYPPKPYNVAKRFKCSSWDSTVAFQGNFSIKAVFAETSI
jgi:phage-related protein